MSYHKSLLSQETEFKKKRGKKERKENSGVAHVLLINRTDW
jgi:hypothetical protein